DSNFHRPQPVFLGLVGCSQGSLLGGERSSLPGSPEPERSRTRPGQYIPDQVREGHDRIVERGLPVHQAGRHDLFFFLLERLLLGCFFFWSFGHLDSLWTLLTFYVLAVAFFLPAMVARRGPLRVRALVCVR